MGTDSIWCDFVCCHIPTQTLSSLSRTVPHMLARLDFLIRLNQARLWLVIDLTYTHFSHTHTHILSVSLPKSVCLEFLLLLFIYAALCSLVCLFVFCFVIEIYLFKWNIIWVYRHWQCVSFIHFDFFLNFIVWFICCTHAHSTWCNA